MRNILFFIIVLVTGYQAISQTDNEFWFVAPDLTAGHNGGGSPGGGRPSYIRLSSVNNPVTVTISQPANPGFTPIVVNIAAKATQSILLDAFLTDIENFPDNTINNKGILIQSAGGDITAYYEIANNRNADIWSLKGKNSLGKDFYVPGQNVWYNDWGAYDPDPYNEIHIVSTEDNTTVEITPSKDAIGHAAGIPFTITLMRGQTFNLRALGNLGADHLCGTRIRVTSGGKIAVTLSDDSIEKNGCRDVNGDQLVPLSFIGTEYLVMKGQVTTNESCFITAVTNNTSIYINGVLDATINAGETHRIIITTDYINVRTSNPAYLYHLAGFGCEMGGAVLPSIEKCTGSFEVSFVRVRTEPFYINLMVRNGGEDGFRIYYEDNTFDPLPASWFEQDPLSGWWVLKNANKLFANDRDTGVPYNEVVKVVNTQERFHLGIMNGGVSTTCNYGYFSDFSVSRGRANTIETGSTLITSCFGDSISLIASGGRSYSWSPSIYLNDPLIPNPIATPPPGIHNYQVTIGRESCFADTTITIFIEVAPELSASFYYDVAEGCAPFTAVIHNESYQVTGQYRWDFNGDSIWDSNTSAALFSPPTYNNTTNTDTFILVRLVVQNLQGCAEEMVKPLLIHSQINANFSPSISAGCNPLYVKFTNTSSGDTLRWEWDFDDLGSTSASSPVHLFTNIGTEDSLYTIRLIAESPMRCRDTATTPILVHPYIDAGFTIDTTQACAPVTIRINNTCIGVDTFKWVINDLTVPATDTSFISTTFPSFNYTLINNTNIPHTKMIRLIGKNKEGCSDTVIRYLEVYPYVSSLFALTPATGCDSMMVSFTNLSTGFGLQYGWDFGDSSSSQATHPVHRYLNKGSTVKTYTVRLTVQSASRCTDTSSATVTVYPFINAHFSVDTVYGCDPFNVLVTNQSVGVSTYTWNFGDGSPTTNYSMPAFLHLYRNSTYTSDTVFVLTLKVVNAHGCRDSMQRLITVYPRITARFDIDKLAACHPALFTLVDRSQGGYYYSWTFGDNSSSSSTNDTLTHLYEPNNSGMPIDQNIILTIRSQNNRCAASCDTTVSINPFIESRFATATYAGCSPFTVTFNNASAGSSNIYRWYINNIFQPSAPINASPYTTTLTNATTAIQQHIIRLDAQNAQNCLSSFTDTVAVYPKVTAQFFGDTTGCHPYPFAIVNTSSNATKYFWTFGDKSSSNTTNNAFIHTYNNYDTTDANYTIKLIASSNYNCMDSMQRTVIIYSKPVAQFELTNYTGCSPLTTTFKNTSVSGRSYFWNFGDGVTYNTTSLADIAHSYQNKTVTEKYPVVTQIVWNHNLECSDTAQRTVSVFPEVIANFLPSVSSGCGPLRVVFDNRSSSNVTSISWDFGDSTATTNFADPTHLFNNNSTTTKVYQTKLTVGSLYQCTRDTVMPITVYATPSAQFDANPPYQMYPSTTVLITNGTPSALSPSWIYEWDMDDGYTSSSNTFAGYTYSSWGKYQIRLVVSSVVNPACRSEAFDSVIIAPPTPIAGFIKTKNGCVPLTVTFSDTSKYASGYSWYFGDGGTSTQQNPTYTYTEAGTYTVQLFVSGDGGTDMATMQRVDVYPTPDVLFEVSPDTVMLPDDQLQCINLTNPSTGVRYLWDFGDGSFSTEKNPKHSFDTLLKPDQSILYSIKLKVWTEHGCVDSLVLKDAVLAIGKGILRYPNYFIPSRNGSTNGYYNHLQVQDNSVFRPYHDGVIEYQLEIYSRWGELMFRTTDINQGWDGYYKGAMCRQGVYVYRVTGKYSNGKPFIDMGNVTLLIK